MNNMQAVAMPQVIFGDVSVCSEEYHSDYFIAAPSCDYDSQNRLIRYDDSGLNVTYVYTYDNRGNILNYRYMDYVPKDTAVSETGGDTYTYSYTNNVLKDAVTDINGEAITYDSSYNPLTWTYGRTFTWVQGRRLETVTDGSTVTTYTYDENGIRVAKNISSGGRSTQYYVADGTYLGEKTTYRGVTFLITYLYGDSGVVGIEVNGTRYFFVKNLQGDVTGIIDSTGAVIANYAYDAYGFCYSVTDASGNNITSATHIANLNPFRYRSYMYDTETGFYYLTTRYYDPDVGRFLNADAYVSTGQGLDGYNMFAYCGNNPVLFVDFSGCCPEGFIGPCPGEGRCKYDLGESIWLPPPSREINIYGGVQPPSLPYFGTPGTSQTLLNPDGSIKQKRWYGYDGTPERDRDYNHPGDGPFPHDHIWKNGKRGKDHLDPSSKYDSSMKTLVGLGLASACAVGISVVVVDDLLGIGVIDDVLLAPLGSGFGTGLSMIAGG